MAGGAPRNTKLAEEDAMFTESEVANSPDAQLKIRNKYVMIGRGVSRQTKQMTQIGENQEVRARE
jgi:hypothetical protein